MEGARDCAIEFRSFSKNAGFTGTRCAVTVIPSNLKGRASNGEKVDIWKLWNRRQSTKFNGVSYIVQRGAEAVYSQEGQSQIKSLVKESIMKSIYTQAASKGFRIFRDKKITDYMSASSYLKVGG